MPEHGGHQWDVSMRDVPRSCPVPPVLLLSGGQVVPHQSTLVAWAAAPHSSSSMAAPFTSWQDVWSSAPKSHLALPPHRLAGYSAAEEGTDRWKEISGAQAPHQKNGSLAVQSGIERSEHQG